MAVYSSQDIDDLRADLGDENQAFSGEELARLLDRAAGNHYVALAMGLFQLLTQSARFNDYVMNEGQERRSEIWQQFKGTYDLLLERPDVKETLGSQAGASGGLQTRKLKYTKTAGQYDEFGIPAWLFTPYP